MATLIIRHVKLLPIVLVFVLVDSSEARRGPRNIVERPLYLTINTHDDHTITLTAQTAGRSMIVGPFGQKWFTERFARLYQILETRSPENDELQAIVLELSRSMIGPIEPAIESCSEIVVFVDGTLEIPVDLLLAGGVPLFLQRPVSYRLGGTGEAEFTLSERSSVFVVSDPSADPEKACRSVASLFRAVTYQDAQEVVADSLRRETPKDVAVLSVHGVVGSSRPDHLLLGEDTALPSDFFAVRPRLVYFDSCRLGVSRQFLEAFRDMGTLYYLGPILSNEAGDSSTRTMTTFFQQLQEGKRPEIAMFLTRKKLFQTYEDQNPVVRLWKAFPFRVYRLN